MRTTVTLDEDVAAQLRQVARERGVSFEQALDDTLRAGLGVGRGEARPYRLPTRPLGLRPGIDLDRALRVASTVEDDEVALRSTIRP